MYMYIAVLEYASSSKLYRCLYPLENDNYSEKRMQLPPTCTCAHLERGVSWVRIPPRAVFSLKKEKAVLGVYLCLALFIM